MYYPHYKSQGWIVRILIVIGAMTSTTLGQTAGNITTVAGIGVKGFSGDGGQATSALVHDPEGVAGDAAGNIYFADKKNHRIRRVDAASGIITTVAGAATTNPSGKMIGDFAGDGGLAINAKLHDPEGVAIDAAGNIYIADKKNQRVRRVDAATGNITTIAGSPLQGTPDGNGVTKKIGDFTGDGGLAINAKLHDPDGVAVDAAGHIYIVDKKNQRIRRVDAATGIITTVAGSPIEGALDGNGVTKKIGDFAGDGGLAVNAKLNDPHGVAVDTAGNIFIADKKNQRIRRVDAGTGIITTVAGAPSQGTIDGNGVVKQIGGYSGDGGPAINAQLNDPEGVAVSAAGNIFIADKKNCAIRMIDGATGDISTIAGSGLCGFSGDDGPAVSAMLNDPHGVGIDGAGNIIIGDKKNQRVRKIGLSGFSVVSWQEIQPE